MRWPIGWELDVGAEIVAPPVVHGDRVLVGTASGHLWCRRSEDGEHLWVADVAPLRHAPVVGEGLVVVVTEGEEVVALELEAGERRWTFSSPRGVVAPPRVGAGGVRIVDSRAVMTTLGLDSGEARAEVVGELPTDEMATAGVLLEDRAVLAVGEAWVAFGASHGESQWFVEAPALGQDVEAVAHEGELWLRRGMDLQVVDAETGSALTVERGVRGRGAFAPSRRAVVDTAGRLERLDGETWQGRWRSEVRGERSVTAAGALLLAVSGEVGARGLVLRAYAVEGGQVRWTVELDGEASFAPTVAEGAAFVAIGSALIQVDLGALSAGDAVRRSDRPLEAPPRRLRQAGRARVPASRLENVATVGLMVGIMALTVLAPLTLAFWTSSAWLMVLLLATPLGVMVWGAVVRQRERGRWEERLRVALEETPRTWARVDERPGGDDAAVLSWEAGGRRREAFVDLPPRIAEVGETVAVLVPQGHPNHAIVPAADEVVFAPQRVRAGAIDRRPQHVAAWSPRPAEGGLEVPIEGGLVRLEGTRLSADGQGGVDLSEAAVEVTSWEVSPDEVELTVTVREGDESVRVRTRWPQAQVSARVPRLQSSGPWMEPEAFGRLWSAMAVVLQSRGEPVWRQVRAEVEDEAEVVA